jgi:predicted HTH domain antitoxin
VTATHHLWSTHLYKELALALYQRRALAQLARWEFDVLLGERKIPRHDTEANLEDDITYGLSYQ